MDVTEQSGAVSFSHPGQELSYYWKKLPDRMMFVGLMTVWCLLFQFFGWTSAIKGQPPSLFYWMWEKWTDPSNDSEHGKLIPWVVLFLLWLRRQRLVKSVAGPWWPGLIGLVFALALHIFGFLVQQPRFSMVALFGGAWILLGVVWGRETLKVAFFPFVIFGFCVPMGGTFAQFLTLPLRLLAAKGAYFMGKDVLDINVIREGTRLMDPHGIFEYDVAAECSGIRSFVALLAITTIFSVLTMKSWWRRAIMILATIPLSLICNILRVTTIILAANAYRTEKAGNLVDSYFGYVTYAVAIGGVLLLAKFLKEKPKPGTPP